MEFRYLFVLRQNQWIIGGFRAYLQNFPTLIRAIEVGEWLFDKEALQANLKLEPCPSNSGFRLACRPKQPAWSFTPFAQILRELGVPNQSRTRLGRTAEITSSKKPLVVLYWNQDDGFFYTSRTTGIHWIVAEQQVVGQVIKSSQNIWEITYNRDKVMNAPTLSLMRPSEDRPDFSDLKATVLSTQKDGLHAQIQNYIQQIADLKEREERLLRDRGEAIQQLERINSGEGAPRIDVNDPRVAGAWIMSRPGGGLKYIFILTRSLTCMAEFKDSTSPRKFLLGELVLSIPWAAWHSVTATTSEGRAISHPHANRPILCLGREFSAVAQALQKRADFGLYVTLLLDHLQYGIDTTDMLGARVISLQELPELPELEETNVPAEEA